MGGAPVWVLARSVTRLAASGAYLPAVVLGAEHA